MKIKILIDNISCSKKQLKGEWGLCVYTEFNGKSILLDTGASTQFAKNAAIMGIDISKIDAGVLSHAHYDHAKFYLRDAARENCYHTHKFLKFFTYQEYIGIYKGTLKKNANRIVFVNGDCEILPGVTLVGHKTPNLDEIGKRAHMSVKENGKYRPDSFDHEQSLVFDTPKGLFIMNSCSHGGADNIIKEIEATFPGKQIYAILGGFHLFRTPDDRVKAFAERLRELNVQKSTQGIAPGNAPTRFCTMCSATKSHKCTPAWKLRCRVPKRDRLPA
ncbi:7,8-dihydropterin-6-yl-methyl-4-(beta-D-ribofuranosyl)aminobenzene 5'-phosphate synthase [Fibrobacter sp. UWB13]|nr:MBL fold metallo-hydrolase [Fibrobacter sp. UWB13]SMG34848.1 7,8-dihydropterin-6-yl-methyl-4-(beta-D-ribofuranosyl)aminobenzene 5'-phosphate synthase [Fibrobacter sp. UWB13]